MEDISKYKLESGNTLRIVRDFDPENPREWDNLGKLFLVTRSGIEINELGIDMDIGNFQSIDEMSNWLVEKHGVCVVKNVFKYSHSGVAYNTTGFHCPWDSFQIGFIVCTTTDAEKENFDPCGDMGKIENILIGEVEDYSQWASGQVYGFIIEDSDGEHIDSCYGFYGNTNPKENGMSDHFDDEILEEL
jgi:hypothetical protein